MISESLEILKTVVRYWSYTAEDGRETVCIHYCGMDYCKDAPYYISANGGVAMAWMDEAELGRVASICAQEGIIIDTINIH